MAAADLFQHPQGKVLAEIRWQGDSRHLGRRPRTPRLRAARLGSGTSSPGWPPPFPQPVEVPLHGGVPGNCAPCSGVLPQQIDGFVWRMETSHVRSEGGRANRSWSFISGDQRVLNQIFSSVFIVDQQKRIAVEGVAVPVEPLVR